MNSFASTFPGKLILILGPSGSGKGTIIKYIKKNYPEFVFPRSYTTREMRPGEKEGEVYHFISKEEFKSKIQNGEFLEYATVHQDNLYGTIKSEILEPLKAGLTVVREVDIQGVEAIWDKFGKENVTTIFITTPSWDDLRDRILGRADMTFEQLEKREQSYHAEMKFAALCDHTIESITGEIDKALAHTKKIIDNTINQ
jgi:guanylate kinase